MLKYYDNCQFGIFLTKNKVNGFVSRLVAFPILVTFA
jgi:hypothetical protein